MAWDVPSRRNADPGEFPGIWISGALEVLLGFLQHLLFV